jgi:hypothetical protein
MVALVAALWTAGAWMFIGGAIRNASMHGTPHADSQNALAALRQLDLAALVALVLLVVIWPAVFARAFFLMLLDKVRGNR